MSNPTETDENNPVDGRDNNLTENGEPQSEINKRSRIGEVWFKIKDGFNRSFDRRPAYIVTGSGVRVEWHDFTNPSELPFDLETYEETQIFLGDYANPWHVQLEQIEKEYSEFGSDEPIKNLVSNKHVIPSQKYKVYMNQTVLKDTFRGGGLNTDRIKMVLYGILGVGILNLVVLIT